MKNRRCKCGIYFVPFRKNSYHCSPKCREEEYRQKPEHRQRAIERAAAWYKSNPEKVAAYRRKLYPLKFGNCAWCNKKWRILGNKKFCNASCRGYYYRKHKSKMYKAIYARSRPYALEHMKMARRLEKIDKPWMPLLRAAKVRATKRGIPFSLTPAWAEKRWTGRCEMSNIDFVLNANKRHERSPSIDQIDAGKGYTPENSRFVLWCVNAAKGGSPDEVLYMICEALIRNNPSISSVDVGRSTRSSLC